MRVQGGDCRPCSAREYKIEKPDVADFALGQTGGHILRRRQRCLCCLDVTLPHQHLCLTRVGQGKTRIGGSGPVICLGCAGVKRQRPIRRKKVTIPRRSGRGG
jgi:hypothetical protein